MNSIISKILLGEITIIGENQVGTLLGMFLPIRVKNGSLNKHGSSCAQNDIAYSRAHNFITIYHIIS